MIGWHIVMWSWSPFGWGAAFAAKTANYRINLGQAHEGKCCLLGASPSELTRSRTVPLRWGFLFAAAFPWSATTMYPWSAAQDETTSEAVEGKEQSREKDGQKWKHERYRARWKVCGDVGRLVEDLEWSDFGASHITYVVVAKHCNQIFKTSIGNKTVHTSRNKNRYGIFCVELY